jgi:hypothetical protein
MLLRELCSVRFPFTGAGLRRAVLEEDAAGLFSVALLRLYEDGRHQLAPRMMTSEAAWSGDGDNRRWRGSEIEVRLKFPGLPKPRTQMPPTVRAAKGHRCFPESYSFQSQIPIVKPRTPHSDCSFPQPIRLSLVDVLVVDKKRGEVTVDAPKSGAAHTGEWGHLLVRQAR